jgi:hypothetical protein
VTVHDTEAALVGESALRAIDTPLVVGGVVSNVYCCPVIGTGLARALPAASWIVAFPVRFSPIEPLLLPVVPDVEAVTVQMLDGAEPDGATAVTVGEVPPRLLVTSGVKLLVVTFLTGSLNVTVQRNGFDFVGVASARTIEETVGAVRSITHEYDAALLAWPFWSTACTRKVCDPDANPAYVMPAVGQVVNEAAASSLHRNPVALDDEYLNVADVALVGFAGEEVIVGVGGALAARAVHAAQPLSARTPRSARAIHALALFAVIVRRLIMVAVVCSLFRGRCARRTGPTWLGGHQQAAPHATAMRLCG